MTEIYLNFLFAHYRLYGNAPVQREVFELTGVLPPPLLPVVWMGHNVSCDNMHMYQVMADNGFGFASVCKSVNAVGVLDTYPLLWVRPSPLLFALSATRL